MRFRLDALRAPPFRVSLLCSILAMLAACQAGGPDAPFAAYLGELGATLSVSAPATRSSRVPLPPRPDELQLHMSTKELESLDFLALSGCDVQATVLKRNSGLGRTAKPSQRLLLELEYLELAPACVSQLRQGSNDALANLLENTWQRRRAQLPALIFNATLGGDEYGAFWQPVATQGQFPHVDPIANAAALAAISHHARHWLSGDYRADNRDFELLLSEVAGGDGGALLQALSRQHDSRAAELKVRYRELVAPIRELEIQLANALSPSYRIWMVERDQRFATFADAPHRHQEQLARIHSSCIARAAMAKG